MVDIEYNPACAKCRDNAGKDRAGVLDVHLCVPHLVAERDALREQLKMCRRLSDAFWEILKPS